MPTLPSDAAWCRPRPAPRRFTGATYSSFYLTMRDGVRIAVDQYLPKGASASERLPTIVHMTRYFRSLRLRRPLSRLLGDPFDHTTLYAKRRARFLESGYAWLDVDVRGSGASFGRWVSPWFPDEVRDGAEIADYVVSQPWSSGKVGSLGISYDGTAAEMLLLNGHPAVRAVAPRFCLFDGYLDIAFPGGIHNSWFTKTWAAGNDALDRNAAHEFVGAWAKLLIEGVTPVAGAEALLADAVAEHADNTDVHAGALQITFRDDAVPSLDPFHAGTRSFDELVAEPADRAGSFGMFSPHNYADALDRSGAAIYGYGGWLDGAYPHAAIKRHLTLSGSHNRLVLGPWNHGGGWQIDPLTGPRPTDFDHDGELLRFFDFHLKGERTGIEDEDPVHYFTTGAGLWRSASSWPPPATVQSFYLSLGGRLSREAPGIASASDRYRVFPGARTGKESRFRTQAGRNAKVVYADRAEQDRKLLLYETDPLPSDVEVTGHPMVHLWVASTAQDGAFIAYLEDVAPDGRVGYVSEGHLRAIHRRLSPEPGPYRDAVPHRSYRSRDATPLVPGEPAELSFAVLPTSHLFRRGHRIRLALSGADASLFDQGRHDPAPEWTVLRERDRPSRLDLPVVG